LPGFVEWFIYLVSQFSYLGVILLSFVGSSLVVFPIPYHIVIFWLGAYSNMDVLLIALAGGLGAAAGQSVSYLVGYAAHSVFSEDRRRRFEAIFRIIARYKYVTPVLIFIFALTPLPDSLIFIPLGLLHYTFLRVFIPCFLGKMCMLYIVAYGGRIYNKFVLLIFGDEVKGLAMAVSFVATTVLLFIIIYAMWKVDWEKVLAKFEHK